MQFVEELRAFAAQLRYVATHYHSISLPKNPRGIVLGGMGGSGIAADFVHAELYAETPFPIVVVKDYELPAWVDNQALVIITSYSGNTEESIALYQAACKQKAHVVVLSTGGTLGIKAQHDRTPWLKIPNGYQPRMTLGYSLGFQMLLIGQLIKKEWTPNYLEQLAETVADPTPFEQQAKEWIEAFDSGIRWVILADRKTFPIGLRFAQQVSENAKGEAVAYPMPEFNHNGVEGLYLPSSANYLMLWTEGHERMARRFAFLSEHLENLNRPMLSLEIEDQLEARLHASFILDFLSLELAARRDVDARDVPTIRRLKAYLNQE